MLLGIAFAPAHEGADGRGCGVEDAHAILGDDLPEPVLVRVVWRAFVHHGGRPVGKWAVDDVAMAGDPANVCGAPISVIFFDVKDPLESGVSAQQVPCGSVDDALGLAGGAAGIKQVQHVFAVHLFRFAGEGLSLHQVVPPNVAPVNHFVFGGFSPTQHNHFFYCWCATFLA